MRVLYAASEVVPYSKTGGLADVAGALPDEIAARGHDVVVVSPLYPSVHACGRPITELDKSVEIDIDGTPRRGVLFEDESAGPARRIFIDRPEFFDREGLYGTADGNLMEYGVVRGENTAAVESLLEPEVGLLVSQIRLRHGVEEAPDQRGIPRGDAGCGREFGLRRPTHRAQRAVLLE